MHTYDLTAETRDYFYLRAQVQMQLAERAEHVDAVRAHVTIAERYLDLSDAAAGLADTRSGGGLTPWRE